MSIIFLPKNKGVLLIVLDDDERELLLLEVQLGDLGPEEEADLGLPLVDQNPGGSETQAEHTPIMTVGYNDFKILVEFSKVVENKNVTK